MDVKNAFENEDNSFGAQTQGLSQEEDEEGEDEEGEEFMFIILYSVIDCHIYYYSLCVDVNSCIYSYK